MSRTRDDGNASTRSVQDYLDETPLWRDGTRAPASPMTRMQRRIWALAIAGKFFEGFVVFMTGVALPLIAKEFSLTAAQHGMVGAASLFGILVGASALGGLADRFGRRPMFVAEMALFAFFLVLILFTQSLPWLLACLFGMGLALGCDYPTAHLVISESANTERRGRLVLSAFAFQSVGALAGMAVGFLILYANPTLGAWRWMYATAIVPAVVVALGRVFVTESPHWLVSRGDAPDAEREMRLLLQRDPPYPTAVSLSERAEEAGTTRAAAGYARLFDASNRRATILASLPWFLQDLGTYGIGIFTPTLLAAAVGHQAAHVRNVSDLVANDIVGAKGAALVDLLLLVGIVGAVLLADRIGRIKLQVAGFIGCAAGLVLAAQSASATGEARMLFIVAGFMVFNFSTNLGPNAQTYLIAGEVFPTAIRAKGAGFAASAAKVGAVATAFLFPILLVDLGTARLLYILAATSILGALVTWRYRIETLGVRLDRIGPHG